MKKLASFDLEIAAQLPEYECPVCGGEHIEVKGNMGMCLNCTTIKSLFEFRSDWKNHRPLGITCADIMLSRKDQRGVHLTHYVPNRALGKDECQAMIAKLISLVDDGYTIVGWNSTNFDFDVLAEESGMYKECAELALNSIDLMFIVVTLRGHYLGLDKAAKGANIQGKLHEVTLTDGTKLTDMSGGKAPGLWKAGEYQAVLDYLADDARSTLELAQWIEKHKMIRWISERGFEQKIHVPKLYTVRECLEIDPVLPELVTNPVDRKSMMEWIK